MTVGTNPMAVIGAKTPPDDDHVRRACQTILRGICADLDAKVIPDRQRVRRIIFDACSKYGLCRVPKNYEILAFACDDAGVLDPCIYGSDGDGDCNDVSSYDAVCTTSFTAHKGCNCGDSDPCTIDTASHTCLHDADGTARTKRDVTSKNADRLQMLRTVLLKKPAKTASGVAVVAVMPKPFACPHGRCTYCPGGPEYNTPNSYTGAEPSTLDAIKYEYDPLPQIRTKLDQLKAFGHDVSKTEIVIVGGTFLFMPAKYRQDYVKSCYDALNGVKSDTIPDAHKLNERSSVRNVGFTIETKPDYCKRPHIDAMLDYGVTRVEIGVQSLRDRIYEITNRGHTYADVTESFQLAKDAGYKIVSHMMPGLPTMTPDDDIRDFAKLYDDPDLRPDMLKIYPSLVLKGTPLYDQYMGGKYVPYSDDEMIRVLADAKRRIPKWVRIMRVQREIPSSQIVAGPRQGNLRQLVRQRLQDAGTPCRCIRCREAGLACDGLDTEKTRIHIDHIYYDSSGGKEAFISYVDDNDYIYGFVRLRSPSASAHRPEVSGNGSTSCCIIRELHVYGRALGVGEASFVEYGDDDDADVCATDGTSDARDARRSDVRGERGHFIQHMGLGRRLMGAAENMARDRFGADMMLVISAVGTRQYYRRLGYSLYGPYMAKNL